MLSDSSLQERLMLTAVSSLSPVSIQILHPAVDSICSDSDTPSYRNMGHATMQDAVVSSQSLKERLLVHGS
jgi:hypothetical protein